MKAILLITIIFILTVGFQPVMISVLTRSTRTSSLTEISSS